MKLNLGLVGPWRGIQGECNSCYMDAAFFAMFAFTSVFDSVLLPHPTSPDDDLPLQFLLTENIVRPLRKRGYFDFTEIRIRKYIPKKISPFSYSFQK